MTTNGVHIPDEDKTVIPEGQEATEAMWIELTNHRGDDDEQFINGCVQKDKSE